MPDITMPYLPTTGSPTSAAGFNNDVYDPSGTPSSLEVINGWLATSNRDAAWKVPFHKIRPGSMGGGHSVGATANLDYFLIQFPAESTVSGAFAPIPGAATEVYVSRASGLIHVSASIVEANSIDRGSGIDGGMFRLYYKAPGDTSFSLYAASQQMVCCCDDGANRKAYFDRQYCWDAMFVTPTVGLHQFYIGIWLQGEYSPITYPYSLRVRARSMSALYIP